LIKILGSAPRRGTSGVKDSWTIVLPGIVTRLLVKTGLPQTSRVGVEMVTVLRVLFGFPTATCHVFPSCQAMATIPSPGIMFGERAKTGKVTNNSRSITNLRI
jgi:hypothetical protein